MPQFIEGQENVGCAEMLVDYVIRSVELVRFMKIWTENENKTGKNTWKGKYLTAACKDANPELYRRLDAAIGDERDKIKDEIYQTHNMGNRTVEEQCTVQYIHEEQAACHQSPYWDHTRQLHRQR